MKKALPLLTLVLLVSLPLFAERVPSETAKRVARNFLSNNGAKATPVVGPLIQTQWDQGNPYNLYCPSGTVTGCVATAMAQVMNYWQYPAHGIGSHAYIPEDHPEYGTQSCDFNNTFYNWTNMANTYSGSSSTVQKQAVATLMYHCGVSVEMNYGPGSTGGSGASTENVAIALKTCFNYSSDIQYLDRDDYTETEWINLLKADLNQNRPIQYSGSGSGGGYTFEANTTDTESRFKLVLSVNDEDRLNKNNKKQ